VTWVLIQKASQATWDDYEQVRQAMDAGGNPPGLIYHAAGEQPDGRWQAVSIWESEDDFTRFVEERVAPAVRQALGDELADAGPPPSESFEAKHVIAP
jgi:heme-degrading monooxygenase HmoA